MADDTYSSTLYPVAYFVAFFDMVDRRVSRCWTIGYQGTNARSSEIFLTFEEWSMDAASYERLVDGAEQEQRIFRARKELTDLEFPNPSIVDAAQMLDGGWLLCPKCANAWESQAADGMSRCPKCGALLRNPRWQKLRQRVFRGHFVTSSPTIVLERLDRPSLSGHSTTQQYTKTTYDPAGNIVHVKDMINNTTFVPGQ